MRLLTKASLRHLTRHPAQLALSVVGVALGVAVVVAIDLAIQSSREAFRVSAETVAGRATHQLVATSGELDERWISVLRNDWGVRAAAPIVEGVATSPRARGAVLRLLGLDPFSERPFRPYVAGGGPALDVSVFVTTPGGLVLGAATASEAGVAPGDSLPLLVNGRLRSLPVVGVLDPSDRLTRAGLRDVVLIDIAGAQDLLGMAGRLSRVDVRIEEGPAGEALLAKLEAGLPPEVRLQEVGVRATELAQMIVAFDLNLTALSLLALLFGMFLIYNAMTFSVVQRRELLGGLRALGVTRREVLSAILSEALLIGVAGAVLGLALGVVLGQGLVRLVTRTINDLYFLVAVDGIALEPGVLAKGAILGVGATLLAALPPALEAAGTAPRLARLRSVAEGRARRAVPRAAAAGLMLSAVGAGLLIFSSRSLFVSFAGLFLVIVGMALLTPLGTLLLVALIRPLLARGGGILGTMAARGVVTALSRTAPAIASLVVAVSVTIGLGIMIQSFRGTLVSWLDGTLRADLYVSLPSAQASRAAGTLWPDLLTDFRGHPDVVGSNTYRATDVSTSGGRVRLIALDLDPRGEAAFDFKEGRATAAIAAFRTGEAVIISEPLAFRRGLSVGDTLVIDATSGGAALTVAGVFFDYGTDQGVAMISRAGYDALFDDDGVTSLGLFLADGADPDAVVRDLRAGIAEGRLVIVRTNGELRSASLEVFDRTFEVTAVLRLLAFIVAFVGVLSALMALELERAREFGVLRAIGLTPGQLWVLVTTQTGLMGLVAGLLATPMGLVLAYVMIHVVNKRSFGWTLRMDVGPGILLQALALALLGSLLAGVYPAWRMARTSPAVALRSE